MHRPQLVQMITGDSAQLACDAFGLGARLADAATRISLPCSVSSACAGPQLVQMFIGDGAKLVRDAFALAKEKSPCIIFIDEIDAIGTKRFDSELTGDREVQRTMLELLNQLDGFSSGENIKVQTGSKSCRACRPGDEQHQVLHQQVAGHGQGAALCSQECLSLKGVSRCSLDMYQECACWRAAGRRSSKHVDSSISGDHEVASSNGADTLDTALMHSGWLDKKSR